MLKIAFCTSFIPKSSLVDQLRMSIKSFCKFNDFNMDWYVYTNAVSYVKYKLKDLDYKNLNLKVEYFDIPYLDRSCFCSDLFKEQSESYENHNYICNYWEWTDVCLMKVFGMKKLLDFEYNIVAHIDIDTLFTGNIYSVLEEFYKSDFQHLGCIGYDKEIKKVQIDMGVCFLKNINLVRLKLKQFKNLIERNNFGFNNSGPEEVALGMLGFKSTTSKEIWSGITNYKDFKNTFNLERLPYLTHLHASDWIRNLVFLDNNFNEEFDISKYPFHKMVNQLVYMVFPIYFELAIEFNEKLNLETILNYILEHYDLTKYKTDIEYIENFWDNKKYKYN